MFKKLVFLVMAVNLQINNIYTSEIVAPKIKEHIIEMKLFQNEEEEWKWVYFPKHITISWGDKVSFLMRSGGPHTVTFYPNKVPGKTVEEKKSLAKILSKNEREEPHYFMVEGEKYTIDFSNKKGGPKFYKGKYEYFCLPHEQMGMTGSITLK
ncbi:MAG: hypothetical protein COB02_16425 [Candidatus Cloacimonadota bacterium]|nr:MAG: hypothetical protein COB02_16425 [Candidatus Cloacimonadota bacterium]